MASMLEALDTSSSICQKFPMTSNTILWITAVIMLCGGMYILFLGKRRTPKESLLTVLHGIIPIIAACLYFAMATGQGLVILPTDTAVATGTNAGRIFYFARYIDWTFTTPLLLVCLCASAVHTGKVRYDLMAGAVFADLIMIATAFAFGASEIGWMKWTWFIVSCAAFLGVYYVIWVSQKEATSAERPDVQSNYGRSATMLSLLWFVYPVILAFSPDGLNVVSDAFAVLVIAVLDVLAKVVYGVMATSSDARATDRDLINPATPSMATATSASAATARR